jgi:hypothetical protein
VSDDLKLLVEWSDPWEEFRTAIAPALSRSAAPLAGEARTGLWPYRGMAATWVLEALLLIAVIVLPGKYDALHPTTPSPAKYDVIYFSGDELPQTKDFGGAQVGKSGRAGGKEAFHRSQTIRVARGNSATEKVVDAPDLKLPVSTAPVANLLAVNKSPGPPPSEGLRASQAAAALSKDAIIAPPPQVIARLTKTPMLSSSVIAPPADSSNQQRRSVSSLATNIVAPPPSDVSADRRTPMTGLPATIISPSPADVAREQNRALVAMNAPIIPPSPRDVNRELPALTGPAARNNTVVPPPVSAPERNSSQNAKLTMPAPAVIAPPPSQVVRDQKTVTGVALGDPQKVVPPPASSPNQVAQRNPAAMMGSAQIVPPPPSVGGGSSLSGTGGGRPDQHGIAGNSLGSPAVIPPPPSIGGSGRAGGSGSPGGTMTASLGGAPIPPPPNAVGGSGSSAGGGRSLGTGLGSNVVAPAPKNEAGALSGRGTGNKGSGLGGPMDAGSALAPANGGGNGAGKGIVISNQPGSAVGRPGTGGAGALAMSPAGGDQPGLGGNGGGTGIGRGDGPGSGLNGTGPGAGKEGTGHGIDPNARGGISPQPGPGGAGTGTSGQPAIPGVSVQGGNTVTLPSFGSGGNDPSPAGHSGMNNGKRGEFEVTTVGTARSGGGFNYYGLLKADKTYTKYLPTRAGWVVMWYADPASATHPYAEDLTPPDAMRIDLPDGLGRSRLVITCVLDRSGVLKDPRVLESGAPDMTAKVMAALPAWKFRPAFHGETPIEVTAILGFNINTD